MTDMHGRALPRCIVLGVTLWSAGCPDAVGPLHDDAGSDARADAGPAAGQDGGGDDGGSAALLSLALSPAAPELPIGLSVRMRAVGSYDDGSSAQLASEVSWSSDAPGIADVGSEGSDQALVTAYAAGTAVIRASLAGVSASVTVTVLPRALVALEVSPPSSALSAGQSVQLSASARYDDDSTADVTSQVSWSSSLPAVASVTESGLVTTLAEGSALIEASSGDQSASSVVDVGPPVLVQVATYDKHSAALLSDGRVLAFGRNRYGQTGVAPGQTEASCALDDDCAAGEVCDVHVSGRGVCSTFCLEDAGCAAGDVCECEATDASGCIEGYCIDIVDEPTFVPGISGATRVVTTAFTTFVLRADGSALGIGRNTLGLFLGNGDDAGRAIERTPQPLLRRTETGTEPLTGIVELKGGLDHVVARSEDGHVYAFGRGWVGQVGDGDTSDENAAVLVTLSPAGGSGARVPLLADAIAAGAYHALAVERGTGRVLGWGWNGVGQLGDGTKVGPTSDDPDTPALDGQGWAEPICAKGSGAGGCLVGASAVDAGWAHSVALIGDDVLAWGWNHKGQLGDGSAIDRALPGAAVLSDVVAIESGYGHVAALDASGVFRVWGENVRGQLGNGTTTESLVPVPLSLPAAPVQLVSGGDHNLALMPDGSVYVWGWNRFGELGLGHRTQQATPLLHPTLPP